MSRNLRSEKFLWLLICSLCFLPATAAAECPDNPDDCAFNLVDDGGYDINGIMLNPRWQKHPGSIGERPSVRELCDGFPMDRSTDPPTIDTSKCTTHDVSFDGPIVGSWPDRRCGVAPILWTPEKA